MALESHIQRLKYLNDNGSLSYLPIIPNALTDTNGNYKATLPTLTKNDTIVLRSGGAFTGEISIPNGNYIRSFKSGSTTALKIIGVNSDSAVLLGDVQYPETRVFTQIFKVPYKPGDSGYPSGGYSLGTSDCPWTQFYGTIIDIGNSTADSSPVRIRWDNESTYAIDLYATHGAITSKYRIDVEGSGDEGVEYHLSIPDKSGTIAVTKDIPHIQVDTTTHTLIFSYLS